MTLKELIEEIKDLNLDINNLNNSLNKCHDQINVNKDKESYLKLHSVSKKSFERGIKRQKELLSLLQNYVKNNKTLQDTNVKDVINDYNQFKQEFNDYVKSRIEKGKKLQSLREGLFKVLIDEFVDDFHKNNKKFDKLISNLKKDESLIEKKFSKFKRQKEAILKQRREEGKPKTPKIPKGDWNKYFLIKGCEGIPKDHCEKYDRIGKCKWLEDYKQCVNIKREKIKQEDFFSLRKDLRKRHHILLDELLKCIDTKKKVNDYEVNKIIKKHERLIKRGNNHFNNIIKENMSERRREDLQENWTNFIKATEKEFDSLKLLLKN